MSSPKVVATLPLLALPMAMPLRLPVPLRLPLHLPLRRPLRLHLHLPLRLPLRRPLTVIARSPSPMARTHVHPTPSITPIITGEHHDHANTRP